MAEGTQDDAKGGAGEAGMYAMSEMGWLDSC